MTKTIPKDLTAVRWVTPTLLFYVVQKFLYILLIDFLEWKISCIQRLYFFSTNLLTLKLSFIDLHQSIK